MFLERWLYIVPLRLRSLLHGGRVRQELDDELRYHLDRQIEAHIAEGMTREQARQTALRAMAGIEQVKERCRDTRRLSLVEDMLQDLRYGFRMLRRNPGFTLFTVLSLALGMGANTTVFSVIDVLMLRALPVDHPEQLVAITTSEAGAYSSYASLPRWRDLTQVFAEVTAICLVDRYNVTLGHPAGVRGSHEDGQVGIGLVSGNYFSTLGVNTAVGRPLTAGDDLVPGGHPVAVISDSFWQHRFHRAGDVVGDTLTLNGTTYTIVGVAPRGFSGEWVGHPSDVWIPIAMQAQVMPEKPLLADPRANWVRIVARLRPGVGVAQAQAAAQVSSQRLLREGAGPNLTPQESQRIAQEQIELQSHARGYAPQRQSFAYPLTIILIVVGMVLLIACANVANLLLARGSARRREIAVRLAIGAGRRRIVRQLLTESFLLVILGGALGTLFAYWGTSVLSSFLGSGLPRIGFATQVTMDLDLRLNVRMLVLTGAMCLMTGLLFGLAPAFHTSKVALASALGGRGADLWRASGRFSLGRSVVILQVALSFLLMVGAGLFLRTLYNLKTQDLGLDRRNVLLVWTAPFQAGRSNAAVAALYQTAQERIAVLPGVLSASPSNAGVLTGGGSGAPSETLVVEGEPPKPGLAGGIAGAAVGPGFLSTLGMTLLAGRDFTPQDTETSPHVAIINETLARFEFGDQSPIGRRFARRGDTGPPWEIIGVVKDTKDRNLRARDLGVTYVPYRQQVGKLGIMCLAVRTSGNPASVVASIRRELHEIDPDLPVLSIATVEEQLDGILIQERLTAVLAGAFGIVALLLACLGLYGVMSYTVARRTNEIGIRLALGATSLNVLRIVLKDGLTLVLAGIAIGVPGALASMRLTSTILYGISAADPLTIGGAIAVVLAVAMLAASIPARRASRVEPMIALRYE